jgi:hypothetical protein
LSPEHTPYNAGELRLLAIYFTAICERSGITRRNETFA